MSSPRSAAKRREIVYTVKRRAVVVFWRVVIVLHMIYHLVLKRTDAMHLH
jgi:hypothetical protein